MESGESQSSRSADFAFMSTLTRTETIAFCQLCSWAYGVWSIHRAFQDDKRVESQFARRHAHFLNRLSAITQEYCLQQLVKLHDRATQSGRANLTISYVVERGDWDTTTLAELERLRDSLEELVDHVRVARNRILAHNDRDTILAGEPLGSFPEGKDDAYFEALQRFVNVVHDGVIGGPYPFDDLAAVDAEAFIDAFVGQAKQSRSAELS